MRWQLGVAERLEPKLADLSEWSARANGLRKGRCDRLGVLGSVPFGVGGVREFRHFPSLDSILFSDPKTWFPPIGASQEYSLAWLLGADGSSDQCHHRPVRMLCSMVLHVGSSASHFPWLLS